MILYFYVFMLITDIIPSRFITNIVPDGRFSAANISKDTQVIMMDEWTSDSLSCEDAKRILQGNIRLFSLLDNKAWIPKSIVSSKKTL